MCMEIENRELDEKVNYLNCVTYVPSHANGNAGHADCEPGVIIRLGEDSVFVLYSESRTIQATNPDDLVWG